MTLTEFIAEINQLYDLVSDPNFQADELAKHSMRWYSSFMRKDTTTIFTVTSGTKTYIFPESTYTDTRVKLIIDDDDTILKPYSIYEGDTTGDFYLLPNGESFTLVFKDTPERTRNTTLLYSRPITIVSAGSDELDIPDKHIYLLFMFIEALSQSQRINEFVWGGLPINYEAYFLGQTSDQVRRAWNNCLKERDKIQKESAYDDLDMGFFFDWQQMDLVDSLIRPINYIYTY